MEILLHKHLGKHRNIIEFLSSGESPAYAWIAMELASGGDLFDKIEADVGIGEDIAHFYFTQLMSAISYMHSKGVAHRDIKPENMLLSKDGDLKIADFGLAALFKKGDEARLCNTVCGSPPYIAPEIVAGKRSKRSDILEVGYVANMADIWSCGVVLFVLLVGNTPWDEPTLRSYEFKEYVETNGRTSDELWHRIPQEIQSLLRGMLALNPQERFTLDEVRTHPWFTRRNPHLSSAGTAANPINLATLMLESLRIDFSQPTPSQRQRQVNADAMDIDTDLRLPATQPETPIADMPFDWERPPRLALHDGVSASQPVRSRASTQQPRVSHGLLDQLQEDVTLSQFTPNPSVPLSLTQVARKFGDIVPSHSLTRFLSPLPLDLLVSTVAEALHRLGIPAAPDSDGRDQAYIRVKTVDGRQQGLNGTVVLERWNEEVCEVRFVKAKGDPLEWRRFFKRMCALCKDAVLVPQ
jgi:serine/threonine-protein kinase CHEK1